MSSGDTKYGAMIGKDWQWSIEHGTNISEHARERWDERTPAGSVSPEHAWEQGVVVPEAFYGVFKEANGRNWEPDEVRTYREDEDSCSERYQASLIKRRDSVTTIYMNTGFPSPARAYLTELWFSEGGA